MVFRSLGTYGKKSKNNSYYIITQKESTEKRVATFDSTRRDESHGIGLVSKLKQRYAKLYPFES